MLASLFQHIKMIMVLSLLGIVPARSLPHGYQTTRVFSFRSLQGLLYGSIVHTIYGAQRVQIILFFFVRSLASNFNLYTEYEGTEDGVFRMAQSELRNMHAQRLRYFSVARPTAGTSCGHNRERITGNQE